MLVIALFTALFAPYFIDWTAYKKDFEEQASRIFGQDVTVGGEAEVRLLPLPSLAFSDLSVGRNRDGTPMLTVERFSANVELMPFLSGEIRVVDMLLDTPVFNFDVDENGAIAWTERKQLLVDPDQVKLDRLKVRNGGFTVSGLAGGRSISGANIDADVSARSLFGPWRIDGKGRVGAGDTEFQITTGTFSEGEPFRLKLVGRSADLPYVLNADGQVLVPENVLVWDGKFTLDPAISLDQSNPQNWQIIDGEHRAPLPVRVEGSFQLRPTELTVSDYRGEIGNAEDPFVVSGIGRMTFQDEVRFRLEVDGRQIDVDRIARMQQGAEATARTLEERLAILREVVNQVPVPAVEGEISLEIPAIIAGDTYIREISSVLRPFGDGWEVAKLTTLLPGNTLVEAKGRLGRGEDFGFTGTLVIASRQPSGFAAWAVGKVDPSIRKLSVAGLSGEVTLTANQIGVDDLELFVNNDRLRGSLNRLAPINDGQNKSAKPAIIADLAGDTVVMDRLRAIAALAFGSPGEQLDALALSHDFDVKLAANRFEGFGISAAGLDTQFQYTDGSLSIVRLNMSDFFDAEIASRGQISDLLGTPEGNLALTLKAPDLALLAAYGLEYWPGLAPLEALASDPALSSDTQIEIEIDARAGAIATKANGQGEAGTNRSVNGENDTAAGRSRVVVNGTSGGTLVVVRGGLKGRLAEPETLWMDLSGEFSNSDPDILAAQAGLRSVGFTDLYTSLAGPMRISMESVGDRQKGWSTLVNADLPGTVLSAKGLLQWGDDDKPMHSFSVTGGTEDIVPVLGSFGYLLPGLNVINGDSAPFSLEADFSLRQEGGASLSINRASLAGNGITGNVVLAESREGAPQRIDGSLSLERMDASLLAAGIAGFDPSLLQVGGFSGEDAATFSGPAIASVVGGLEVKATEVRFPDGTRAENASLTLTRSAGKVEVADLSMNILGGTAKAGGVLGMVDGTANLSGQVSADGVQLSSFAGALGFPQVINGQAQVSATIEASGKTPQALVSALSGNGVVVFTDAAVDGVSASGFRTILETGDVEGFQINAGTVGPLARNAFLTGSTMLGEGTAPFSLRNGELNMRNVVLGETPEGALRPMVGNLAYSIDSGVINADITVVPDPGKDAVEGGTPEVGFAWSGTLGELELDTETGGLEGFLSIRAFEAEQRKVETLQAAVLETQRFRRDLLNSGERGRWLEEQRLAELRRIEEERIAREEAERKAQEEAERLAREEAERKALEEAEKLAREEAERKAQEEAERLAREQAEAERLAQEEAERKAKEEADRLALEQAEAGRLAEEARNKAAELEEQRLANEAEASRLRQEQETEAPKQIKQGVEAAPLAPPAAEPSSQAPTSSGGQNQRQPAVPRSLFENLERLLMPKRFE